MSNFFVFIAFEAFSLAWSFCFRDTEGGGRGGGFVTILMDAFIKEKRECIEEEWGGEMDLDEIPKTKSSQELTRWRTWER